MPTVITVIWSQSWIQPGLEPELGLELEQKAELKRGEVGGFTVHHQVLEI